MRNLRLDNGSEIRFRSYNEKYKKPILNWIIYLAIVIGSIVGSTMLLMSCSDEAYAYEGIVIHHTATPPTTTVESIRRYHVEEKGWQDIGYNFLIGPTGEIKKGRDLSIIGAHALNPRPSRNTTHIGIAFIGHSDFTEAQYKALRILHKQLEAEFGDLSLEHHHEECPGPRFEWGRLTQ